MVNIVYLIESLSPSWIYANEDFVKLLLNLFYRMTNALKPLNCILICVHTKHLGRVIPDLGIVLLGENTLSRVIPDLAVPT
jgi:hypothetical protein